MSIGYEFLKENLAPTAFDLRRPARIKPVSRVIEDDATISVPAHVAPRGQDPQRDALEHILFALKHEGTNLQILAQALPQVPEAALRQALTTTPMGSYVRTACFLWEEFTGRQLDLGENFAAGGQLANLFDPEKYVTGVTRRIARWRVNSNGLGDLRYCPSVERTCAIEAGIASDVLGRTKAFVESLGTVMADRALAWAYMHETQDSFAIERESPSEEKARAFVALLHQAHDRRPLDEQYLVELQTSVVSNAANRDAHYRHHQNWLRGPANGAAGVTYLPPPPDMVYELMDALANFANEAPAVIDPIVAASIASFGFVFIHPFTDGNGRLSRFLFHHALCRSGRLSNGLILPVSVAMKRDEGKYLAALQSYSRPARALWNVTWIDEGQYALNFTGHPSIYRYWDATDSVEFGFQMAEQALNIELRQETEFLARYDHLERVINANFDVQGNALATLIRSCLQSHGFVSNNRRKQFLYQVPAPAFDFLESEARALFIDPDEKPDSSVPR